MRINRIINPVSLLQRVGKFKIVFASTNGKGNILDRIPLIRAGITKTLKANNYDFNAQIDSLFKEAKLPMKCYEYPEALIPLESCLKLFDLVSQSFGDSSLGLKIGNKLGFDDLGKFGEILATCPNLGVLITKIDHYFGTYTNGIKILHARLDDNVHWLFTLDPEFKDFRLQYTELIIAFLQKVIKMTAGENWTASEVHFEHTLWGKKSEMEKVFQTSLKFSMRHNALIFHKKILELPIKTFSPEKNENINVYKSAPNGNFAIVLKQVLKSLSLEGRPKLSEVSTMIGLGPRTIQRLLAKEGTNFRELVDLVCFERGADLLAQENKNLLQIALMQGYSDGASFSRAFKRWAGVTPSEYRSLSFEEEIHQKKH